MKPHTCKSIIPNRNMNLIIYIDMLLIHQQPTDHHPQITDEIILPNLRIIKSHPRIQQDEKKLHSKGIPNVPPPFPQAPPTPVGPVNGTSERPASRPALPRPAAASLPLFSCCALRIPSSQQESLYMWPKIPRDNMYSKYN